MVDFLLIYSPKPCTNQDSKDIEKDLDENLRMLRMRYQQAPVNVKKGCYKYVLEASKHAVGTFTETRPRELVRTNGSV